MVSGADPTLSILNRCPSILDGPRLLHELIQNASSKSTECAIDFLGDGGKKSKTSYQSLHALSDTLAETIRHKLPGLNTSTPIVPVLLKQSPELYIAILATLKAGGAFCPLNLDTPEERLRFILQDTSARLLITTADLQSQIPTLHGVEIVVIDNQSPRNEPSPSLQKVWINPNALAYVLYTSGSTGVPKAVSVSHRAVTQSLLAHNRHIPHFSRFLQFAAPTFDVSIFEIFFPLFRGATIVCCDRSLLLNDLPNIMRRMEVDAAELTPTAADNLLNGRGSVPGLKILLTIGEMLTRTTVEEFGGDSERDSILWGMYGPTEAAIHCTLQPAFQRKHHVGNIGFPLDTVSVFVATPARQGCTPIDLEILPKGQVGELVVGGPQVAQDYLNRPELTASAFMQHNEFGYLYRTGDKARILPNGTIECLGRIISGQVKLRGQRVELGEVQQVISKIKACRSVTVQVIADCLVAFCVVDHSKVSKDTVINTCRRWLPRYMIPVDVIFISNMPQLPSGKIDQKGLEKQYLRTKAIDDSHHTEVNDQDESHILGVVQQVLGRKISSSTNLASVGLDSLRAIRIASFLRTAGYQTGAIDVLTAHNVKALRDLCKESITSKNPDLMHLFERARSFLRNAALETAQLREREANILDIIPCTPLQQAMLTETMSRPSAYCNWVEMEVASTFTSAGIRNLLEDIISRNEILRTGFCITSSSSVDSFAQIIWKDLEDDQVKKVSRFSRKFSMSTVKDLLHPLRIQINMSFERPRILFQIHHALYDGWSLDLVLQDLSQLAIGKPAVARPQFREIVNHYSAIQERKGLEKSKTYWTDLLCDYHPSPLQNFHGRTIQNKTLKHLSGYFNLDSNALSFRAAELRLNPQVFFQAGLAYILGSYQGTHDVVYGTVTSGRTIPVTGIEETMGPCIATLPLRVELSGSLDLETLLNKIQASNRAMLSHSAVPLKDIKKACGLPPGKAIFDVVFVWQESLLTPDSGPLSVKILDSADEVEFKLTLEVEPRDERLYYKVTYDSSVLPAEQIKILLNQLEELVNHFIGKDFQTKIDNLGHIIGNESLSITNAHPTRARFDKGLANAVERWARQRASKPAIIFGAISEKRMKEAEIITYAELNARANQLANALRSLVPSTNELVCVYMDKSVDLYVAILAIIKLGLGYLPVTPETPWERTRRILDDAQAKVCVSDTSVSGSLRAYGQYTVLDMDKINLADYDREDIAVQFDGSKLAYAVFTSGSTGTPKGVLVTQNNLLSNLNVLSDLYPVSGDSRLLQSCSQAFDVSVFEIFFSWYTGMCLCSATKDALFYNLEGAINALSITHLSLTPTVAALVDPKKVSKVKFLVTAGEALTEQVRRQWAGRGLFQGYGPSETTNICTVKPNFSTKDLINNIGPPLKNTSAFILDPDSNSIVLRGGVGELCFGGDQVFRGYLNMPGLTTRKVLEHPKYGRIYRSGDLGQLLPGDSILFVGRADDQVKIRGQRVELGEINSCILDHKCVQDCASVLIDRQDDSQALIAFWVPSTETAKSSDALSPELYSQSIADLYESLSSRLPTYMVPTNLVPINSIPMTQQSKIDKRQLTAAYRSLSKSFLEATAQASVNSGDFNEMSDIEQQIAGTLAKAIGITESEVKRHSSFFNLGLDSVSAISFSRLLRKSRISDVPVSVILQNATVSLLASKTRSSDETSSLEPHKALQDVSEALQKDVVSQIHSDFEERGKQIEKILPCTPLQEAMLSGKASSTGATYCNRMLFEVHGEVDRLQKCWATMFERHAILRTCFVPIDDPAYAFAQVLLPYQPPHWDELRANPETTRPIAADYAASIFLTFSDQYQPPVRLATIRTKTSTSLVFCCHHAVYDGVAITQLLHEIEREYKGVRLPNVVPYEYFFAHLISQDLEEADRFWKKSLANFEPTSFPDLTGTSKKVNTPSRPISVYTQNLKPRLIEVQGACRKASVSLLSMVQSVWTKLLHSYTGESDLCFGNVMSGRTLPVEGLERLVAPCFNTIPMRVKFDFESSNLTLVKMLHDTNVALTQFQLTPLRRIQHKAMSEHWRLFDTLFILQQPTEELDDSIWRLQEDSGEMDVPIVCEIVQDKAKDTLKMTLHYDCSIISHDAARIITETFNYDLLSCIKFPHAAAANKICIPPKLLSQSNTDFCTYETLNGPLLHSAFQHNASIKSMDLALDFQHDDGTRTQWTFKDLDQYSNKIATALIENRVEIEDVVPVFMDKCPHFYASILGILKAGAAFTPFNPDLPYDRIKFMASEIKPRVILCVNDNYLSWAEGVKTLDVTCLETFPTKAPIVTGLKPTHLAYCLYTSGSTGRPKAVGMEHRSPIQTVESSKTRIVWTDKSRLLQYAAITFDMCYYDCFLAWSLGFCLCAAKQATMLNDLISVINSMDISLLDLTPSIAAGISRVNVPSVEYLYCIGEPMRSEIVDEWHGRCVNSYGPTEAAFCCTIFPVEKETRITVIGKPFTTTSFTITSNTGNWIVPLLGIGELLIGGAQIARGYYANDELTKSRFIERDGQIFYRSGDMVRMLPNGNFEFVGRVDDQVKIRGLRVELGEINNVIQNSVAHASAVSTQIFRKSAEAKDQLVTFIQVRKREARRNEERVKLEAREAASQHLPPYMVPQAFVCIDRIPLSQAGKVDKNALLTIFRSSEIIDSEHEGETAEADNWTTTEKDIRSILSDLSRTHQEQIRRSTTIHQLGLDSISAVQIAAALRRRGYTVTATEILQHPSVHGLSRRLDLATSGTKPKIEFYDFKAFEQRHINEIYKNHSLRQGLVETIRPCTPLQKGILSQYLQKEGGVYFNYMQVQLEQDVSVLDLRMVWQRVMENHQMLRTGFAVVDDNKDTFVMIHYATKGAALPWHEVRGFEASGIDVEEWLRKCGYDAMVNLHRPPWRLLLEDRGQKCLHLALLHALYDARSLQIILQDVMNGLRGIHISSSQPIESALAEILTNTSIEDSGRKSFWRRSGQGAAVTRFPNMSPLRLEHSTPLVLSRISTRSVRELEASCRAASISLQAVGIASWATLLATYTGQPSVVCGVVLSGRISEATSNVAFPCITTVPFVCQAAQNKQLLLRQIMSFTAEVQNHQFVPLNEMQRSMGYPGEQLFDTIFAYQKILRDENVQGNWSVVNEKATIDYPISIEVEPIGDQLELRLTFLPHILPEEQASLLLDQMDYLIDQFTVLPDSTVDFDRRLYSITPAKERHIMSEIELLHDFVESSTTRHPDKVAFEFASSINGNGYNSRCWTYKELDAEGNRVANFLLHHGVQSGDIVGVCFDKCPEASFAILGILKAGCAYVALDPTAPSGRRAFIVQDSEARLVLSMKAQSADIMDTIGVPLFNLDEASTASQSSRKPKLHRSVTPRDRSYCLYTSGTTGTPKGCEITHENAVQAMLSFQRLFRGHWDAESRWLQFASFHFDVSVLEQYWSWSVGVRVVSAPRDVIFEDLAASIRVLEITHIDLTPSLARILHPDDVPTLCRGVFITGGEQLKQEILDVWGPKSVIYNGYGPTEATIGVTMYPRVPKNGKPSNIGPQFDNVGSYVFTPNTEVPVFRGGVGELCVAGELVGKGYLNRPDLTKERFPYIKRFQERVYRTGDLVRLLHDNSFEFLGRADDQVKLRGQRLEIGEINSVVKQAAQSIIDVSTLVLKHPNQQKEQLVAFVVTGSASITSAPVPRILLEQTKELRFAKEACEAKLPGYMVPTHFVRLNAMPLSANNKADGRKLTDMYNVLSIQDLKFLSGLAAISNETWSKDEEKIKVILQNVTQLQPREIQKSSSFFELGLDSVSVIGFTRRLKEAGFSGAKASLLMKYSSISRLARVLRRNGDNPTDDQGSVLSAQQQIAALEHRHRSAIVKILDIKSRDIEAIAPCTPLQEGMIARSLDSDQPLYFASFHLQLADSVDENKLRVSWERLFEETQILRTWFLNTEDGYLQISLKNQSLPWEKARVPLSQDINDYLEALKREWYSQNKTVLKRPFEIVVVSGSKVRLLAIHIFHALYDGISLALMLRAIQDIYREQWNGIVGRPFQDVLPHGPQRKVQDAESFWTNQLSESNYQTFPPLAYEAETKTMVVTRKLTYLVGYESIRRKLNVTPQAIAQACWVVALQRYLRGSVTIGMVVSGRAIDMEGADRVIGPMFNTIPFHCQLHQADTWASVVKRCHDFNVSAQPYQHTALRDIMKWCKRTPTEPLFDTLFVYQMQIEDTEDLLHNDLWRLLEDESYPDYPLALEVEKLREGSLKLTLASQGHILNETTSAQILEEVTAAFHSLLEDPNDNIPQHMGYSDATKADTDGPLLDGRSAQPVEIAQDFEWTPQSSQLRQEIASLAGIDPEEVTENTSIFELGLDSIDAIKLSTKLKKRGFDLPVSSLIRSLNIRGMDKQLSSNMIDKPRKPSNVGPELQQTKLEGYVHRTGVELDHIEAVFPTSPLQEAMVAEMISSNYARYYNHDVMKLAPETSLGRLNNAWSTVIESSPILRTSFVEVDDPGISTAFAQVVHKSSEAPWKELNVKSQPDFSEYFERIREAAIKTGVDAPLVKLTCVRCPTETYLILSIPHALYDGWSLSLLHNDIHHAYFGKFRARPSYEPALRQALTASGPDATLFWEDYLWNSKITAFPCRFSDSRSCGEVVHRMERSSKVSLDRVVSFSKSNRTTLQILGQTVWSLVLASYLNRFEVVFGSVLSGRDTDITSEVLFPTMNTVTVRSILHGTRREMVRYMQDSFAGIIQFQNFPLRRAQALAGTQSKLFDSLFIYQKRIEEQGGKVAQLYESVEGLSDVEYPVCVEMEVLDNDLLWRCACKDRALDEQGAIRLLDSLDTVLNAVIEDPDAPTITFTENTNSICGLPSFTLEHIDVTQDTRSGMKSTATRHNGSSSSETAREILKTLSTISQVPEDEIEEGMSIFHIGLDSISAIKVSSLLRKQSISLSVSDMLKAGTVEKMAQLVNERSPRSASDTKEASASIVRKEINKMEVTKVMQQGGVKREDVEDILPASAGQVYMLSTWMNSEGALFYPEFSYRIPQSVGFDILLMAWKALVSGNDILRTLFLSTNESSIPYIQIVQRSPELAIFDVTGFNKERKANFVERQAARQPYISLFAAKNAGSWELTLKIHHALYDGVSLPALMSKLQDLCNDIKAPPLDTSAFKTFMAGSMTLESRTSRQHFWTRYLGGFDRWPAKQYHYVSRTRVEVFKPRVLVDTTSLESLARQRGLTTQSLFLAAYTKIYAALYHHHEDKDIVVGLYLANRFQPIDGLEGLAAPTVNLVPLRVKTPLKKNLIDTAVQIQQDIGNISTVDNSAVGLWEIDAWTGVRLDTFVNFLKLPDVGTSNEDIGRPSTDQITIVEASETPANSYSRSVEMTKDEHVVPEGWEDQTITQAYLPAIDVEATIKHGSLDVGVFAMDEMLSEGDANKLIDALKEELMQLLDDVDG